MCTLEDGGWQVGETVEAKMLGPALLPANYFSTAMLELPQK